MIYTVTLNPALDKTVTIPEFTLGKVNYIEHMRIDPGGKGINISKVLKGLGGHSVATGILGGSTGTYIRQCLDEMNIEHDFAYSEAATRTNLKITDLQKHTNTDVNEPGPPVAQGTIGAVLDILAARVSPGDMVALAGKLPPGASDDLYAVWIRRMHSMGATVCLDTDGLPMLHGVKAGPDLIKPNEEEFSRLVGKKFNSLRDIAKAAMALHQQGIAEIVISLGAQGALFVRNHQVLHAGALSVPVKSTVGAGDATMAALILGNQRHASWHDTIRTAIAAGAASVMCEGTEAIALNRVEELKQQVIMEEISI